MKRYIFIFALIIFPLSACEDFLDKEPVDSIADQSAITDLRSAQGAIDGLYNSYNGFYQGNFLLDALSRMSDELNGTQNDEFTFNNVQPISTGAIWGRSWVPITRANHIIEKVPEAQTLTVEQKEKFIAEAKFIRALEFFFEIQFFGDFPWTESTDFRVVQDLPRSPISEVYSNIISDLMEAEQGLPSTYDDGGGNRARVIKSAATALLARIYLYQGKWAEAESKATEVINNSMYSLLPDYPSVFANNSRESILEYFFQDLPNQGNTIADLYLPESLGGVYLNAPSDKVANAFETGDLRKDVFLSTDTNGLMYISKYKEIGANQEVKVMRLAEMYLIGAEARAQQGDIAGAAAYLNTIRNRAGLPNTSANDPASMLTAIEQERFVELCFEGHRWTDLIRTNRADEVMSAFNPTGWQPTDKLLPIPQGEIDLNPNLSQNPGY